MKVIGFTEDKEVIEKILKYLGSWDLKARPPRTIGDSEFQISFRDSFYANPNYLMDSYVRSRVPGYF